MRRHGLNGPGLLVVLEGIDGSGKTTQALHLVLYLRSMGIQVLASREPGGTPAGRLIRHHLLDPPQGGWQPWSRMALFLAARHEHVQSVVRPSLVEGKVVVLDRFTHSTLAYQGAGDRVPRESLIPMAEAAADGVVPDLVLLLDLPAEIGLQRVRMRNEEVGEAEIPVPRNKTWLNSVARGYRALAKESAKPNATAAKAAAFVKIDANRNFEEVAAEVQKRVDLLLAEHGMLPGEAAAAARGRAGG